MPCFSSDSLELNKSGYYEAEHGAHGLRNWYNAGTYFIDGDIVTLNPEKCRSNKNDIAGIPCENTLGVAQCVYKDTSDSFYYTRALVCSSRDNPKVVCLFKECNNQVSFYDQTKPVPSGLVRTYKGIDVVTMGAANGVTIDDVKIREIPSTEGKILQYAKGLLGDGYRFPYVPKGTTVTVLARTVEKSQVNNWNNYWYLVDVDCSQHVWMFGEFVILK